ncbi:unnamed protein product [Ectocarpus sp. CCAP 1310/34]|nr:unnamed protein product [Ectocarpus sp. CCAP 1310/34]
MEPLQSVDPNVDTHKRKVSQVCAMQCSNTKRWRLRCMYHPQPHATGIRKNTAFKYETKAEALGDADNWTSELEKPMRRRSLSPKHGTMPNWEVAKKSAIQKQAERARTLRGLQQEARILMRLRCRRLRNAGLGRRTFAYVRRDRKSEQRRRHMERRVAECDQEDAAMDAQAVAMFSTLTKGQHVTLLEPHEQPPPVTDAPTSDISVADPPEVLAAHAAAAV